MKRFFLLITLFAILISTTSCAFQPKIGDIMNSFFNEPTRQDKVLETLGQYDSEKIWTHGSFQDYTDYGIYSYSSVNLNDNEYFNPVTDSDSEKIKGYIDDFEGWIDFFKENDPNDELVLNYNFDRSIIDTSDYFYIFEKDSDIEYACYDLWIFDTQTNTLYYLHNNI